MSKAGSHMVVIVEIFGNRKQVQANRERNLSHLLQLICFSVCLNLLTITDNYDI